MRIFHELLFDVFIPNATGFFPPQSPDHWFPVVGNFETIRFMIVADRVTGANLQLSLSLYEGADWTSTHQVPVAFVASGNLAAGQTNIIQGTFTPEDAGAPLTYGWWVFCNLVGDPSPPPTAHVKVWVTGRGRA